MSDRLLQFDAATGLFSTVDPAVYHDAWDLQGRDIDATAPTDGDALVWSAAGSCWTPGLASGGAPAPHAASHGAGDDDPVTPAAIGADVAGAAAAVAASLVAHDGANTGVHGVGSDVVASEGYADGAVAAHAAVSASVHGVSASGFEDRGNRGAASGYCALDAGSKVAATNLGGAGADASTFLRGDRTWAVPPQQWTEIVTSSDQGTTSTTPAAIGDLQVSLGASSKYLVEATILYTASAQGLGIRLAVNGDKAVTSVSGRVEVPISATAVESKFFAAYNADTSSSASAAGAPTLCQARMSVYVVTGADPVKLDATVAIEAAQSGTITVKAGSYLRWKKVA